MRTVEEIMGEIARLPFYEKLGMVRMANATWNYQLRGVSSLHWEGCLCREESFGIKVGDGDYCVYLWKHAWGEPFYVGSGKGDRWKVVAPRCDDFYYHLDQADAVVYRVVVGANREVSRMYEKYLSFLLRLAGYTLTNKDYSIPFDDCTKIDKAKAFVFGLEKETITPKVQKILAEILGHTPSDCDYRATCKFIEEYGSDYFSRNHIHPKVTDNSKTEEE